MKGRKIDKPFLDTAATIFSLIFLRFDGFFFAA